MRALWNSAFGCANAFASAYAGAADAEHADLAAAALPDADEIAFDINLSTWQKTALAR